MADASTDADDVLDTASDVEQKEVSPASSVDEADSADRKASRKRERETSLEPMTPKLTPINTLDTREHRTSPAKKGRVQIETLQEEESQERTRSLHSRAGSDSGSRSPPPPSTPPVSSSPPHEVKVRQISQGVEDLSWQQKQSQEQSPTREQSQDRVTILQSDVVLPSAPEADKPITDEADAESSEYGIPPSTSRDPGAVDEDISAGQGALTSDKSGEMAPTEAGQSNTASTEKLTGPSACESCDPELGAGELGFEKEKGVKRKLADRGTSVGLSGSEDGEERKLHTVSVFENGSIESTSTPALAPAPAFLEGSKRPRDDADKDDNPRETKRPSPPPEKESNNTPRNGLHANSTSVSSSAAPAATPQLSGFMAYASTSSPFAAVKGKNIFSGASTNTQKASTSSSSLSSASPSILLNKPAPLSPFTSPPPTSAFSTATKRTGFEAFAGSASPFATAAKSPLAGSSLSNNGSGLTTSRNQSPSRQSGASKSSSGAFSLYASGGVQAFAPPASKRARAASPGFEGGRSSESSLERVRRPRNGISGAEDVGSGSTGEEEDEGYEEGEGDKEGEEGRRRPVTFGEKLRAGRDEEEVESEERIALTEQAVHTGEEDEETVHQVRGKLFALNSLNTWTERGTGTLKLNVRREDGMHARLVMRKEAVYTVILNVTLFNGMKCFVAQDPRYLRFSVIENGTTTHYNLRVANAKIGQDLLEVINNNIPCA